MKVKLYAHESFFWKVKVRLQYSGWLQYIPVALISALFLLLAILGWRIAHISVFFVWMPLSIGFVFIAVFAIDVITVKAGIRPAERAPGRPDGLDAFDLMRHRRSCHSFQARDLSIPEAAELRRLAHLWAQPSNLLGPMPIRFEYVKAPLTVWPVVGAREFFVAIAPKEYNSLSIIDVGRSLQHVVVGATQMGIGTCWIGPGADHESIIQHLGDRFNSDTDHVICVCALGYPSRFIPLVVRLMNTKMRRRLPISSLFFRDPELHLPLDSNAPPFDRFGRCYEACQWSPSSFNGQTTRCVALVDNRDGEDYVQRFDFVSAVASLYYAPVALGIWCANWEIGCEALSIGGRFEVLSDEEWGPREVFDLPRYYISWIQTSDV